MITNFSKRNILHQGNLSFA